MISFTKMHGIGNDFVMVDLTRNPLSDSVLPSLARAMCARRLGIGADGLITADLTKNGGLVMRMFNPDGSESEMCGNGIRCFAVFANENNLCDRNPARVQTGAGMLTTEILPNGNVSVDMGAAGLTRREIGMSGPLDETFIDSPLPDTPFKATAVSMGNPHLVLFVENVDAFPLEQVGPALEVHPRFPHRTNVHVVEKLNQRAIKIRTWERGAGLTLACGTGACACAVASTLVLGTDREVSVSLPGGDLNITYAKNGHVFMSGPAETSFEGQWKVD